MEVCSGCEEVNLDVANNFLNVCDAKNELIFESGEMIGFMYTLNMVLNMPCVKKIVLQHNCVLGCVVCKMKKAYLLNKKSEFKKVIFDWFQFSEDVKGYTEQCWHILNKLGICSEAYFEVEFECGMHYGLRSSGVIVYADELTSRINPFYESFLKSMSLKALILNSDMIKKANNMFELIMESLIVLPSRMLNIELKDECCVNPKIDIRSEQLAKFFYFEINWDLVKSNIINKIAQVLVSLPSSIDFGGTRLYLHSILSENSQGQSLYSFRSKGGVWYFDGLVKKLSYAWSESILFLAFSSYFPKLILYESTQMFDLTLNDEEMIKIEKCSFIRLGKFCNHKLIDIKNSRFLERIEKKCNYCKKIKFEGEKCINCGYNEGSWFCINGHKNIYTSLSCDSCNTYRCFVANYSFECQMCGATTNNQLFCSECSINTCKLCDRIIYPGQSVNCINRNFFSASFESSCQCHYCVFCYEYNDERLN